MEVIKKRCFSSHLRSNQEAMSLSSWHIYKNNYKDIKKKKIRCPGCSSLSTLLRIFRFAYLTYERKKKKAFSKRKRLYNTLVEVSVSLAYSTNVLYCIVGCSIIGEQVSEDA